MQRVAGAAAVILLASCATQTSPPATPRREPPPARDAKPRRPPLTEESVGPRSGGKDVSQQPVTNGTGGDTADAASPEPVAPPDPNLIVASIGPSTPPQRVASLRLTDEGRRLLAQGNAVAALDRIEKAVKIDPSNPHGYYWLAQVHLYNGRLDQALAFADKSVVLFSQGDHTWLAQAYTFRASVLERAGRFPEARDSYRHAVQVEPGNVAARAGLGRLGEPATP